MLSLVKNFLAARQSTRLDDDIDFAVVVFEAEIPLLTLLARSFALFGSNVGTIHVLINDENCDSVERIVREKCLPAFGRFQKHVKIHTPADFDAKGAFGYQAQQCLKLAVAGKIKRKFYVCLDAKNHFLAPFNLSDWLVGGKARMRKIPTGKNHHNYLRQSMSTFGIYDFDVNEPAVPTVTPYVMRTDVALHVCSHIKAKTGENIFGYLHSSNGRLRTEFFLYYAALYTDERGIDALATFDAWRSPTLFGEWPVAGSKATLDRIEEAKKSKMFAVHRRRFKTLTAAEAAAVSSLWVSKGLLNNEKECFHLIDSMTQNR